MLKALCTAPRNATGAMFAFDYELAESSDPNIADLIGPVPGLRLVNQLNSGNTAGILVRRPVVRRTRGILRVDSVNTVKTHT